MQKVAEDLNLENESLMVTVIVTLRPSQFSFAPEECMTVVRSCLCFASRIKRGAGADQSVQRSRLMLLSASVHKSLRLIFSTGALQFMLELSGSFMTSLIELFSENFLPVELLIQQALVFL